MNCNRLPLNQQNVSNTWKITNNCDVKPLDLAWYVKNFIDCVIIKHLYFDNGVYQWQ